MTAALRPDDIDQIAIADFAGRALWLAKILDAVDALSEQVSFELDVAGIDVDEASDDELAESPFSTALAIVDSTDERLDLELEADLIRWLEEDPEHWGIFRMLVIDPWQTEPGTWKAGVPYWVVILATNGATAHFYFDKYGRRVPWSIPVEDEDEPEQ